MFGTVKRWMKSRIKWTTIDSYAISQNSTEVSSTDHIVSGEDYLSASGKRVTESALGADQTPGDLSIIIGASWIAPNQTRGLIEVHFPEKGYGAGKSVVGGSPGLSSPGIKLLLQTLRNEESAGVDDVGGDDDGILSVAKLKYRAKVCTLDNAGARARAALRNRQYWNPEIVTAVRQSSSLVVDFAWFWILAPREFLCQRKLKLDM